MYGLGKNCLNCPILPNVRESLTDYVKRFLFVLEMAQTSMQLFFCAPWYHFTSNLTAIRHRTCDTGIWRQKIIINKDKRDRREKLLQNFMHVYTLY